MLRLFRDVWNQGAREVVCGCIIQRAKVRIQTEITTVVPRVTTSIATEDLEGRQMPYYAPQVPRLVYVSVDIVRGPAWKKPRSGGSWKSLDLQMQLRLFLTSATCSELLNAFSPMLQQTPTAMRGSNSFIFCTKAVPGHHPRLSAAIQLLLMNADVTRSRQEPPNKLVINPREPTLRPD
jgi:hypothetical protein